MSLHDRSVSQLLNGLRSGDITSETVARHLRQRIDRVNPKLNAFAYVDQHSMPPSASAGPLAGMPVTVKDQIQVAGLPCTSGIPSLLDYIPSRNAPVVESLTRQGAWVMGKTALPPLAMDFQTNNTLWGTTENPWRQGITAGGSCGGGAAAVAAGLSFVDMGADLAGSLRIPASFCGVCSLMPSDGVLSNIGTMALFEEANHEIHYLARVGPIARTVEDLQIAWSALHHARTHRTDPSSPRLLISLDDRYWQVGDEHRNILTDAVRTLTDQGVHIKHTESGAVQWRTGWSAYGIIQGFQVSVLMTAFQRWLVRVLGRRSAGRSPSFLQPIHQGYRRDHKSYDRSLIDREELSNTVDSMLESYDAWMLPVTRVLAFPHVAPSVENERYRDYRHDFQVGRDRVNYFDALTQLTTLFNLTGHPVVTLPVGVRPETGLPVGVQLVGRKHGEADLLAVAALIQRHLGVFRCPMLDR